MSIKGIEAPFANALRRILIDDIETIAVDKVVIYQNTSVMQDEILAHRLGLIPILVNPDLFDDKSKTDEFDEKNCVKFYLNVKCVRKNEFIDKDCSNMKKEDYLENHYVLAKQFKWEPIGDQAEKFKVDPPKMLFDEILVNKLGENQEIELEVYCSKNSGKVHTKWSPVSTAYYKLKSVVGIKKEIKGKQAEKMKNLCPMNVFGINKKKKLIIENEDNCTFCRACIDDEELGDDILLAKERMNYIFTIESIGAIDALTLFKKALKFLIKKSRFYQDKIKN